MLADAFASDPNAAYFFGATPAQRHPLVRELFEILMSARVALSTLLDNAEIAIAQDFLSE